jgi:hypothetical protein
VRAFRDVVDADADGGNEREPGGHHEAVPVEVVEGEAGRLERAGERAGVKQDSLDPAWRMPVSDG